MIRLLRHLARRGAYYWHWIVPPSGSQNWGEEFFDELDRRREADHAAYRGRYPDHYLDIASNRVVVLPGDLPGEVRVSLAGSVTLLDADDAYRLVSLLLSRGVRAPDSPQEFRYRGVPE